MKMRNHFNLPILVNESFDYDYMAYCEELHLIDDQAHAAAHAVNYFDDLVLQFRNAVGILKSINEDLSVTGVYGVYFDNEDLIEMIKVLEKAEREQ